MDPFALNFTLVRFEERFALLRNDEHNEEIRWPIKYLQDHVKPGDIVTLKLTTNKLEEQEKYARMRRLLEELIN